MVAPTGNQFWKVRAKHGREKTFSNPEKLWESACEYFEWCDANPWMLNSPIKSGDNCGENVETPAARPYTISGLCIFLDCNQETIRNYGSNSDYQDYFGIVGQIRDVIYTQKFEGATVGTFNANIIARDLGLRDGVDTKHSGSVGVHEMSGAEIDEELKQLLGGGTDG